MYVNIGAKKLVVRLKIIVRGQMDFGKCSVRGGCSCRTSDARDLSLRMSRHHQPKGYETGY